MSITHYPLIGCLDMCYGYSSFRYKHKIFVYGGCSEDETSEYFLSASEIYELNLFTGVWTKHDIKENSALPNHRIYSLMVPHNDTAFLFCGFDINEYQICDFRGLNLNTFEFQVLSKPPVTRRDKLEGWTYRDDIYFFGGYGPMPRHKEKRQSHFITNPESEYHSDGWNNELVAYSTKLKSWFYPNMRGTAPCGRAAYGLAQFGHRIYFVCGRRAEKRCSEIHMLDMRELEWSGEIAPSGRGPVPEGRSWMVCSPIGRQNIFVQGGISNNKTALSDMWLFNIDTHTWSEITPHQPIPARVACRAHVGLSERSLVVVSGRKVDMWQFNIPTKELGNSDYMVLQMEPTSLRLTCLRILYVMLSNHTVNWNVLEILLPAHIKVEYLQLIK